MDTILVVNAGSSDLRFHVYSVEGEGRLRQRLKGQMNGIGRCPRLRASRAGSGPLANRAYPTEAVPDVAAAMISDRASIRLSLAGSSAIARARSI